MNNGYGNLGWVGRMLFRYVQLRHRWPAIVGILRGRQVAYRVKVIDGGMVFDDHDGVCMYCTIVGAHRYAVDFGQQGDGA